MKRLLSIAIAVSILVLWVSPGFTGERYRIISSGPACKHNPVQHVTVQFNHYTLDDIQIWPWPEKIDLLPTQPPPLVSFESLSPVLDRKCRITRATKVGLIGDIVGENPLLSDVFCVNSNFTAAHVEAVGWLKGTLLDREEIEMFGRMTLDIDRTVVPPQMTGYWVFEEGVGTHYGMFRVEGEVISPSGLGTYVGWVRKNK
jgi:hypothetical protein